MKNRAFSTIVIVLLFTLVFLLLFRACAGAVEGNLDDGNADAEIIEGDTSSTASGPPSPVGEGEEAEITESDNETEGVEPPPHGDDEEEFNLKTYVEERIVPVIVGVGTAIIAMLSALGPAIKAFKAMRNAAKAFSKKDEERNESVKESNRLMQKNIERIESNVADVPKLQAQVKMLERQADEMKLVCVTLAKITALGFQANADVVRSGKGKKMAVMLKKLSSTVGDVEGEFQEIETTETIPQSPVATAPFAQRSPEVMENDEAKI